MIIVCDSVEQICVHPARFDGDSPPGRVWIVQHHASAGDDQRIQVPLSVLPSLITALQKSLEEGRKDATEGGWPLAMPGEVG